MHKISLGLLAMALLTAVCAGPAGAATPLDPSGDVTGWVPPGKGILKCERYMNKRVSLVTNCALTCHIKNADAIFKNVPFSDDFCENTSPAACESKYDRSLNLLNPSLCPACLDAPSQQALYPEYRDITETVSPLIYCDSSNNAVPFGANGMSYASLQHDVSKCEDTFARNVYKLIKCLNLKCHRALADDLFAGTPAFNNPACEDGDPIQSCQARYETANAKLVGCPPCVDAAHRATVFDTVQQALDSRNGLVYCAQ